MGREFILIGIESFLLVELPLLSIRDIVIVVIQKHGDTSPIHHILIRWGMEDMFLVIIVIMQ